MLPAPPPSFDTKMFSGLYRFAKGEDRILLITWCKTLISGQFRALSVAYPRFEIDKNGARYVVFVVCLVEKHVLAITTLGRPFFEDAFPVYAVFCTQALPVHRSHLMTSSVRDYILRQDKIALWLPHCPSWTVTISRGIIWWTRSYFCHTTKSRRVNVLNLLKQTEMLCTFVTRKTTTRKHVGTIAECYA